MLITNYMGENKAPRSGEKDDEEINASFLQNRKGKCRKCGKEGHWARECPTGSDGDDTTKHANNATMGWAGEE